MTSSHTAERYQFVLVQSLAELNGLFSIVKHYDLCYELCYQSDSPEQQESDFLETMSNATVYRIMHGDEVVGIVWLNGRIGNAVAIHTCVMPDIRGKEAIRIGRSFVAYLLGSTVEDGRYWVDTLLGFTPATHRHALLFAKLLGFKLIGTLANAATVHGEVCDVFITQLTRDDLLPVEI